jgi:hypothetical protein
MPGFNSCCLWNNVNQWLKSRMDESGRNFTKMWSNSLWVARTFDAL